MKRFLRKRRCSVGNENQNAWDTNKSWIILLLHSAVKKTTKCIISLILVFVHNLIKESLEINNSRMKIGMCWNIYQAQGTARDCILLRLLEIVGTTWIWIDKTAGSIDYSKVWSDMECTAVGKLTLLQT